MQNSGNNSRKIVREAAALIVKSSLAFLLLLWLLTRCQPTAPTSDPTQERWEIIVPPPTEQPAPPEQAQLPEIYAVPDEEEAEEEIFLFAHPNPESGEIDEMVFEEAPEETIGMNERTVPDAAVRMPERIAPDFSTEEYDRIYANPFRRVGQHPVSTFSIDVDNASYSNVRRFLTQYHQLPPPDAVRIEEMINYFDYDYPQPTDAHPFALYTEIAPCPWNADHQLLHVGLQGKSLDYEHTPPSNLVFLIDVSGSMEDANKLPLVKKSFRMLVNALEAHDRAARDRVAIVVYAGAAGLVLPSTPVAEQTTIEAALARLSAGGATAGGEGIELAYQIAREQFIPEGNNRVILATDGDFNIGTSSTGDLVRLIEEQRQGGVYLTLCGFGMGNYKDGRLEQISNAGNGNYFYIDNVAEAEKVFVRELRANLFTLAKDVKLQLEFNPTQVKEYRLIGYENRVLAREDFDDDQKDAGELGAGHTVTALYELIPAEPDKALLADAALQYQQSTLTARASSNELLTLKLRYKPIGEETSVLMQQPVNQNERVNNASSPAFRLAAAVAAFGMKLRSSPSAERLNWEAVGALARTSISNSNPNQQEFLRLVEAAALLAD